MREGSHFFEWTYRRIGGGEFPATILLTRVEIGSHAFLQATVRDISRQKQMEMELNQAQKLEAVGRLAAGIAHEINTPTQYVGDNLEFLQIAYGSLLDLARTLPSVIDAGREGPIPVQLLSQTQNLVENTNIEYLAEQVPRAIEQSLEGIGRIATIVQAMKEFSHPGVAEKTTVDLNQCIRSTATVSRNEWKYVADLDLDLDDALPQVLCLPGDFNQAILNMIVNAAHAIGDVVGDGVEHKGKITVSTRQEGAWAVVRIADTGSGIPEEIRERIFDPFFTTKEVGRGTGQGLAIARNVIVDKHGGTLAVESEVGKGTTFIIRLPIESVD
jgi:signal transduction histidine kinase